MIRTGYLRWEIDVQDVRSRDDPQSREVVFLARPSFRIVRIKHTGMPTRPSGSSAARRRTTRCLRTLERDGGEIDVRIPDVGPRPFRYSESDRARLPRYWMEKLQREVGAFAPRSSARPPRFPSSSSRARPYGPAMPGWSPGRSSGSSKARAPAADR